MILCFDTYYYGEYAKTVCLAFEEWTTESEFEIFSELITGVEEYIPGEFYKRELPCILSLLKKIPIKNIEAIIVDGFVYLDDANSLGLGGHLYNSLEKKIPIIGVAKTNFSSIINNKRALYRGESKNPLYITSIGMEINKALQLIENMAGSYRIPTLLKNLDSLTKQKDLNQDL